jgi:hypothetical protein
MDEQEFIAAAYAKAEKLRSEALENALSLSYGEKIHKITGVFHEVVKLIEKSLEFAPSYILLEYNIKYRLPLEAAIANEDLQSQVILTADIIESLLVDDERIETALAEGDGDFNGFIVAFTEAGILANVAHGVMEAMQLEDEFSDLEDE